MGIVLELGQSSVLDFIVATPLADAPSPSMLHQRKHFYTQAASGLVNCHTKSVAHLDVKPNNMILADGVLKLCDFGFSARLHTKSRTLPVSPGAVYNRMYRAPELHTDEKKATSQSCFCTGFMYAAAAPASKLQVHTAAAPAPKLPSAHCSGSVAIPP